MRYIKIGDPVAVRVPALNQTGQGKVARFSVDVNSNTRTMHTEVDVPNPKGTLVPGLYAEAILTMNQRGNAVTVPIQAIDRAGDQASVTIIENGETVQKRPVTLGIQTANYAEVASGLTPGEHIVISDRSGLKDGERVVAHPTEVLAYEAPAAGAKE